MRLAQRGAREKTPRTIESIGLRELSNRQDHRLAGRGFERGCWVTRSQKLSVFTGLTRVENYAQPITLCKSAREPSEKPRKVKRRILPDRDVLERRFKTQEGVEVESVCVPRPLAIYGSKR